jgi:hypothetical protein
MKKPTTNEWVLLIGTIAIVAVWAGISALGGGETASSSSLLQDSRACVDGDSVNAELTTVTGYLSSATASVDQADFSTAANYTEDAATGYLTVADSLHAYPSIEEAARNVSMHLAKASAMLHAADTDPANYSLRLQDAVSELTLAQSSIDNVSSLVSSIPTEAC